MNRPLIAALIGFVAALACAHGRSTPYDNYVLLADALLHHRIAIAWPGTYIDAILVGDSRIVIEGPVPALLVLPLVAVFGPVGWTQTLVACALCGVATGGAWTLAERYGVPPRARLWIVAFFVAGTDLLWCAMLGDVWFIAHVAAAAFSLLALVELAGKRRGWLVALYAVCAFESRFPLVLALVPYAILLLDGDRPVLVRRFASALGVIAIAAAVHGWYDLARFGTLGDAGFRLFYEQYEHEDRPMFRLDNLPMQLHAFFVQPPRLSPEPPYLTAGIFGMALPWTSPALALAFLARPVTRRAVALWLAAFLCAAPSFLYYDRGGAQFGMRHALDFEPFVFGLIALAVCNGIPAWGRVLVVYSVVAGMWGIVYWNVVYRPLY